MPQLTCICRLRYVHNVLYACSSHLSVTDVLQLGLSPFFPCFAKGPCVWFCLWDDLYMVYVCVCVAHFVPL